MTLLNIKVASNFSSKVALIGRVNVGKSTLYNRLVGGKTALVLNEPGLTRDIRYGDVIRNKGRFTLLDTPGLFDYKTEQEIVPYMEQKSFQAIEEASFVCLMIDGQFGITVRDLDIIRDLRKKEKKFVVLVNKVDSPKKEEQMKNEMYEIGCDFFCISAEHGVGINDFMEHLESSITLDKYENTDQVDQKKFAIKVAIMGRPNVGKSTFVNKIIGEDRFLVSNVAGSTRDSLNAFWTHSGKTFELIDTAGIRKKFRGSYPEELAVMDAKRSLKFSHSIILMIDASCGKDSKGAHEGEIEKQDMTLISKIMEEGRSLIVVLSKWDLVKNKQDYFKYLKNELHYFFPGLPILPLSSEKGEGIENILDTVIVQDDAWNRRISTSEINQWLKDALEKRPIRMHKGINIKIKYITQIKSRPPTFIIFGSNVTEVPESHRRYLINSIRNEFNFGGIPMRIRFRDAKSRYSKETRK